MFVEVKTKNRLILIPFILVFLAVAVYSYVVIHDSSNGRNYFPGLAAFSVRTTDDLSGTVSFSSYSLQAKFVRHDLVIDRLDATQKSDYVFTTTGSNAPLYLLFPIGTADNLKLVPGEVYSLDYEVHYGWPTTLGLTVTDGDALIFAGVTDYSVNRMVKLAGTLPVTVNQSSVLAGHYINGTDVDPWARKTNTEIAFAVNGDSAALHQGQSATLDGYGITLLIAEQVEYKPGWPDAGQPGISYTIALQ
jgi:hypothetical protein